MKIEFRPATEPSLMGVAGQHKLLVSSLFIGLWGVDSRQPVTAMITSYSGYASIASETQLSRLRKDAAPRK